MKLLICKDCNHMQDGCCDFQVKAENISEIVKRMMEHVGEHHSEWICSLGPTELEKMKSQFTKWIKEDK